MRWLPMIFFLFVAAQAFSSRDGIPPETISVIMRLRWQKARRLGRPLPAAKSVNISYPYFMLCLLAASFHSSEDEIVPFSDSRRLYVRAHDPKELVEIHGSHREAFVKSFDTYYDKIEHFVFGPVKDKPTESSSSTETNLPASKEPTP